MELIQHGCRIGKKVYCGIAHILEFLLAILLSVPLERKKKALLLKPCKETRGEWNKAVHDFSDELPDSPSKLPFIWLGSKQRI